MRSPSPRAVPVVITSLQWLLEWRHCYTSTKYRLMQCHVWWCEWERAWRERGRFFVKQPSHETTQQHCISCYWHATHNILYFIYMQKLKNYIALPDNSLYTLLIHFKITSQCMRLPTRRHKCTCPKPNDHQYSPKSSPFHQNQRCQEKWRGVLSEVLAGTYGSRTIVTLIFACSWIPFWTKKTWSKFYVKL
jgi:hypothetical protein